MSKNRMNKSMIAGIESRIAGALLGVHAGDSLGATLEFMNSAEVKRKFPKGHREIIGGGSFQWGVGDATDDTDLTMAIARAYRDGYSLRRAADNMAEWKLAGPRDIGGTTSRGLANYMRTNNPKTSGIKAETSAANGSLMRCIATGLVRTDGRTRRRESAELSRVTHAERRAVESCVIYNDLVSCLVDGMPPADAIAWVLANSPVSPDVKAVVAGAPATPLRHLDGSGFVLGSLGVAVWALSQDSSIENTLAETMSLGGDTDTHGAIAGGLLGAAHGVNAIPARWLAELQFADEMEGMVGPFTAMRVGKTGLNRWFDLSKAGRKHNTTKSTNHTTSVQPAAAVTAATKRTIFDKVSLKLKQNVVTLDCDGTIYDSWKCCKKRDSSWTGSAECAHLREDTVEAARALAKEHDASLVILSWRGGGEKSTREWLARVGLDKEIDAVFVPGGSEDIASHTSAISSGYGQVAYKVKVAMALQEMGHTVVGSFDDRDSVIEALGKAGVKNPIHVKHAVVVADHEWSAGYIGAPKKPAGAAGSSWGTYYGAASTPARLFPDEVFEDEFFGDELDASKLMDRETFEEMMEMGRGEYGIDYVFGEEGEVIPLIELADDEFDAELDELSATELERRMDNLIDEMVELTDMREAVETDLTEGNWQPDVQADMKSDLEEIDGQIEVLRDKVEEHQAALLRLENGPADLRPSVRPRDEAEWRAQQSDRLLLEQTMERRAADRADRRLERALRQSRKGSPKTKARKNASEQRRGR